MNQKITTKAGVFESGEKDVYGVQYKEGRLLACRNSKLTEYAVQDGTVVICDRAFMNLKDLKMVELPESVRAIGEAAFSGCKALESVNIPEGVAEIRQGTFRDCDSLHSLVLPASCSAIDKFAFGGGLEEIVINASEMDIHKYAFSNCPKLQKVMVPPDAVESYRKQFADMRLNVNVEGIFTEAVSETTEAKDDINDGVIETETKTINMDKVNDPEEFIGKLMDSETRTKIEELLIEIIPEDVVIYTKDPDFEGDEDEVQTRPIEFTIYDDDNDCNRWVRGTQFRRVGNSLGCFQMLDTEVEELYECDWRVDISPENYRAILSLVQCYKDGNFGTEDEVNSITFY